MVCNPRGGISSKLTIDSDWKIRGGDEKFKDWTTTEDTWEVRM
jgi:7-cyano-7-deazaguanine reductase